MLKVIPTTALRTWSSRLRGTNIRPLSLVVILLVVASAVFPGAIGYAALIRLLSVVGVALVVAPAVGIEAVSYAALIRLFSLCRRVFLQENSRTPDHQKAIPPTYMRKDLCLCCVGTVAFTGFYVSQVFVNNTRCQRIL
jgi:hypothetical protein